MKKMWIHAILPVLVVATMVACGGHGDDDGGTQVNRARGTTPAEQQPQVQDENKMKLPDDGGVSETKQTKQTDSKETPDEGMLTKNHQGDQDQDDRDGSTDEGNSMGGGPLDPGSEKQTPVGPTNPVFTGAGTDDLRDFLTETMEKVSDSGKKQKNYDFAQSIQSVRARVDVVASQAVVTVMSNRSANPIILSGAMSRQGNARLSSRSGLSGIMTCLDLDNSNCQVSLITLRSKGATALTLVRHTAANASLKIPTDRHGTNDFLRLADLFSNTQQHNGEPNSLRQILVQSFEVINGASGIKVSIISLENQLITANGPLIGASDGSSLTNVVMNRDLNLEDLVEVERHAAFKTDLNQAISEIRMVENDGVGNVALLMTVNGDKGKPGRSVKIGIKRVNVQVVPSSQVERLIKN